MVEIVSAIGFRVLVVIEELPERADSFVVIGRLDELLNVPSQAIVL